MTYLGRKMSVLVVDDSPVFRRAAARLLASIPGLVLAGFAADASSAIAHIDRRPPDVVLLDVDLANEERGFDVLSHVSARHPAVRVVALSNFGWTAMRAAFLAAGAAAYFDKAYELQEAFEWLARLAGSVGPARQPSAAAED